MGGSQQGGPIEQLQVMKAEGGESVPFNYKYLMITFMIIKYCWEQFINMRQLRRNLIREVPPELRALKINQHEFLLSQSYSFDKMAFEMLALSIRMAVDCLAIMCNILPFIWNNVDILLPFISMESEFQRAVGYVLIEAFLSKAFEVPIAVYKTFIIEKKYNFTNKTVELFVYDLFVEAALMLIIFPPIIYGYLQVIELDAENFYFSLQIFVIAITIILTWLHPNLIAPLFNNFTEFRHDELKARIQAIADAHRIKLKNVFIINSSVRSQHSNAYLYGIGSSKTIVLSDSLLNSLNDDEVLAVVGHQLGHSYDCHSFKKMAIYLLEVLSMFYVFGLFIKNQQVFISFGFSEKSIFICTALYFHLFQPLVSIFNLLLLIFTRKCQFQADAFSCRAGLGLQLKSGLIKLLKESTATVRPDVLYAWIKDSHPSIHERIEHIDACMARQRAQKREEREPRPPIQHPASSNLNVFFPQPEADSFSGLDSDSEGSQFSSSSMSHSRNMSHSRDMSFSRNMSNSRDMSHSRKIE